MKLVLHFNFHVVGPVSNIGANINFNRPLGRLRIPKIFLTLILTRLEVRTKKIEKVRTPELEMLES